MRYHIGQYIIYRNRGICKVENIGKIDFSKSNQDYYTLRPPFTTCNERIYVPVHTDEHMRTAMTPKEAYTYLSELKQMNTKPCRSAKTTLLTAHYQGLLSSDDINAHLKLFKEICQKEVIAKEKGKKLGETDKRFRTKVEQLLSEELAIALNESPEVSKERLYAALQ